MGRYFGFSPGIPGTPPHPFTSNILQVRHPSPRMFTFTDNQHAMNSLQTLPAVGVLILAAAVGVQGQQPQHAQRINVLTPEQQEILSHISIVYLDDGQGGQAETIRFTGVNVQVVNGLGSTSGTGSQIDFVGVTNGTGNLIVGYNEDPFFPPAPPINRTGSHNLIVGYGHNYTKFGGVVFGRENALNGAYSSILSGTNNTSDAVSSAIVSGLLNTLTFGGGSTFDSVIVGGGQNDILGGLDVVVGGQLNQIVGGSAGASGSVVVGGFRNLIQGGGAGSIGYSSIVGGRDNLVDDSWAVITGGRANHAAGDGSVVSGGNGRTAFGSDDWVAGSLLEDN